MLHIRRIIQYNCATDYAYDMNNKRYAIHPEDFRRYDTSRIRDEFLIEEVFGKDLVTFHYTHYDRMIVGGAMPVTRALALETKDSLKSPYFLERREIGIINVGSEADIIVDGATYTLSEKEALYIGKGVQEVTFAPAKEGTAFFYYNSAPAHHAYPTRKVSLDEAETTTLGNSDHSNHRTIRKLLVNSVLPTCHLQMGLTELQPGSVWNTMPPHTHDRRMEVYFYFGIKKDQAVCHFLGEPDETRHIWMNNHQAVLSPPWSVHSGAGTSSYSFIWSMAGENLDYSDMDLVEPQKLK
jgi:4-deoxy-L-threo-5-hexosulose-uronate ketol-isomerase